MKYLLLPPVPLFLTLPDIHITSELSPCVRKDVDRPRKGKNTNPWSFSLEDLVRDPGQGYQARLSPVCEQHPLVPLMSVEVSLTFSFLYRTILKDFTEQAHPLGKIQLPNNGERCQWVIFSLESVTRVKGEYASLRGTGRDTLWLGKGSLKIACRSDGYKMTEKNTSLVDELLKIYD